MIKSTVLVIAFALLSACAKSPPKTAIWIDSATHNSFAVDEFVAVALEYEGPRAITGVDTYGPTQKEVVCQRSAAAAVSQSADLLPHGHTLVTTCLHVKFGGPLPRGIALAVPPTGKSFEYLTVGVEYGKSGAFVGAQALHPAPDLKTCMREARDVIGSNYKDGHITAGNSLLLYCMPVPVIEHDAKDEGGIV